jgi:NAD(P)-dependent dehydrogenase (short-subunit alcohol dehydrogenase family)
MNSVIARNLVDRVAIVTGGARGIGLAIAQRLHQQGAKLCLWDRDASALDQALALFPAGQAVGIEVDVCSQQNVEQAAQRSLELAGRLDVLVNCAGVAGANAVLWEASVEDWRRVIEVNLTGPFLCCRAVVPHLIANGWGRIVNIASVAGKEGNPTAAHYSASKAGVIGMTKSLGKELAKSGVLVNCVTPAVIQTDILKQVSQAHIDYMLSKIPIGRFGLTDEAAAMVGWLCSPECSFTTAAVFDLSGGRATY